MAVANNEIGDNKNAGKLTTISMAMASDNEISDNKNAGKSMTISMAMAMQRYDARHIARWSTSRASLEANRCRHRASACALLPRRLPWSTNSNKTHKTLTKHNF